MSKFIKKNGSEETFDPKKIHKGIVRAMKCGSGVYHKKLAEMITEEAEAKFSKKETVNSNEVDKFVLGQLMEYGQSLTAHAYERFKTLKESQKVEEVIDKDIMGIVDNCNSAITGENANKDARKASTQRDLIAGVVSRSYTERKIMPTHILAAHNEGLIHVHDTDYMINPIHNCQLINLLDMLENGTVINGTLIRQPKSFLTACTVATQISLAVASGQYGGQTFSTSHLSPYVRVSYEKYLKRFLEEGVDKDTAEKLAQRFTRDEVKAGVQTIQYQELTFSSTNGQTPFVSIYMQIDEIPEYEKENVMIIEEMLKLRYDGLENEYGVKVTPAFPKLLYVLDENNIHDDSEYRWLTDLAIKCSALRMNPDYLSAKKMREMYEGNVFPTMGCRSLLRPWKDENGNYKFYGRFNRGVVSINLVDAALSARNNVEKFWHILDERLELVKEALIMRDKLLRGTKATISPIHWQHGSIARLDANDAIDKYLDNGYSSISLGYVGLHEMVLGLLGVSITDEKGKEFALKVLQHLNDKADEWRKEDHLHGCSVYGTPAESLVGKFERTTKKRFGEVKGITDKEWFTNSYHVCVTEPIDAFTKLSFEGEFQKLSKGGCISYVELGDLNKNIEAVTEVVKHIYENNIYAEINLRSGDHCGNCGYKGEIKINDDNEWECPQCGCKDITKMSVARRICGYLGLVTNELGKHKVAEMKCRYIHL